MLLKRYKKWRRVDYDRNGGRKYRVDRKHSKEAMFVALSQKEGFLNPTDKELFLFIRANKLSQLDQELEGRLKRQT
ncbi:hypothetical protein [Bacillus sp. JCM 19041]|uniref:hypothetical protein n=1 Tax=Bacillus sp. JCM 19041 TaxID=1460637 RepID=UPI0006D1D0B8